MSAEAATRKAGPTEQYCSTCGEIIKQKAEICPECGVRNNPPDGGGTEKVGMSKNAYATTGLLTGAIGFFLLPVVFGPVSVFCGYQIYRYHDERMGLALLTFGFLSLIVGMYLGIMMWA